MYDTLSENRQHSKIVRLRHDFAAAEEWLGNANGEQ
jgi:hypothetical protein